MGKFKIPPDGTKSRRTLNEIISKPRLWYTNLVGEVTNFRGGSLVYEQGLWGPTQGAHCAADVCQTCSGFLRPWLWPKQLWPVGTDPVGAHCVADVFNTTPTRKV